MDFQMPTDLRYLWRYMLHMYQLDAFTQSCPADQDIVNHYKQQQVGNNMRPAGRRPSPPTLFFLLRTKGFKYNIGLDQPALKSIIFIFIQHNIHHDAFSYSYLHCIYYSILISYFGITMEYFKIIVY